MTRKAPRHASTRRRTLLSSSAVAACRLAVEPRPIAGLKLDDNNPRQHPPTAR